MKFHQIVKMAGGKIEYDRERAKRMLEILYDGVYLVSFQRIAPKSTIKDFRAAYFAKIDILADETGHTRYEMHDIVKNYVLSDLAESLPEVIESKGEEFAVSTKGLTIEGWPILLERLDLWAFTEYNVILQ